MRVQKPSWYRRNSNSTISSRIVYFVVESQWFCLGVHVMHTFWHRRTASSVLLIAILSVSLPSWANPPAKERLPLMLSGSGCGSKEAEMHTVLQAIPGVTGVYFNRIPDHVLVDITAGSVKASDVVHRVNDAATSWQCKVELMQSCITADMPSASAPPHHSE
jgi:hypothetical protein